MKINWQLIIPAFLGFIGGAIASIIAPWVHWKIEKVRLKVENRKARIKECRDLIQHANSFEDIRYSPAFAYLKKKLSKEEIKSFHNHVFVLGGGDGEKMKLMRLLEVVDEIEQEWGLL